MNLFDKVRGLLKSSGQGEKIHRLKDIDTREVSLVDHPAIDEPFIEIKSKDGNVEKEPKEEAMDKKDVEAMISTALAPLAEGIQTLTKGLEAINKSVNEGKADLGKIAELHTAVTALKTDFEDFTKESVEVTTKVATRVNEIVDKINAPRSEKIAGGEGSEQGNKGAAKWPSLAKIAVR